jgi:hypothetical protein
MQFEAFKQSLEHATVPEGISIYLLAMWYDAKKDWDKAHHLVNDLDDATACWVHAYLHRKEGDIGNADYWYRRANKKRLDITLDEEWEIIVKVLLS